MRIEAGKCIPGLFLKIIPKKEKDVSKRQESFEKRLIFSPGRCILYSTIGLFQNTERKRQMKRFFTILLALCMLLTCVILAACGDDKAEESKATGNAGNGNTETSGPLVPTLGDSEDYRGMTLTILVADKGDLAYSKEPFKPAEVDSEPVNDACISRLDLLEQTYGIKVNAIFEEAWADFPERIKQDRITGSAEYDVVTNGLTTLAPLAAEGAFLDLNAIEGSNLHLNESWWDKVSQADMTIANKLFFATGDILLLDDEFTTCMFYNKDFVGNYNLDDPSAMALEGTWTLDEMYEMAASVAHPEGGSQMTVTGEDVWGIVCVSFDAYKLTMGADAPQVIKNDRDLPELAMTKEYNIRAFEKVYEIMTDKTVTAVREDYYAWNDADAHIVVDNFYAGQALFMMGNVADVNSAKMRETQVRYGILPMPKFDINQENYATTVDPYSFACISIMSSCEDTDFVTFALEALACLGEKLITPQYYTRTLENKRFPDDVNSPEVLEILFNNRLVDISVAFNWNDCIQYYNNIMWAGGDVVSYVEKVRSAFDTAMQETLESFQNGGANE